jgi:hypothetical protein
MDQAIEFLAEQLNQHIKQTFGLSEDAVIVGRLKDDKGLSPPQNENKLVLSLINVTTDVGPRIYNQRVGFASSDTVKRQPLFLNLDFLMTANFSSELETTKFLTTGIRFFHERPDFSAESVPSFPEDLSKITLEMYNLSLKELDSLWSAVGTHLIPSAMYKIRVISAN